MKKRTPITRSPVSKGYIDALVSYARRVDADLIARDLETEWRIVEKAWDAGAGATTEDEFREAVTSIRDQMTSIGYLITALMEKARE